jgi:VCBS repeat-containing protein
MPGGGKVFIRPEVTTHTSIAQQAAEFDTLQAGTLVVTDNQVTKKSFGGFVQISEQDLDWTDPAILSIVLDDLGRVYAQQTDNEAADALVAGATVTENFTVASINDPTEWRVGSTPPLRAFSARQTATCRTTFSCRRTSGLLWASSLTARTVPCSRRLAP